MTNRPTEQICMVDCEQPAPVCRCRQLAGVTPPRDLERKLAEARAEIERLLKELDDAQEAALHIIRWTDAYPVTIVTPISDDEIKAALQAANAVVPNAAERIHSSWARHILRGVRGYAQAIVATTGDPTDE